MIWIVFGSTSSLYGPFTLDIEILSHEIQSCRLSIFPNKETFESNEIEITVLEIGQHIKKNDIFVAIPKIPSQRQYVLQFIS